MALKRGERADKKKVSIVLRLWSLLKPNGNNKMNLLFDPFSEFAIEHFKCSFTPIFTFIFSIFLPLVWCVFVFAMPQSLHAIRIRLRVIEYYWCKLIVNGLNQSFTRRFFCSLCYFFFFYFPRFINMTFDLPQVRWQRDRREMNWNLIKQFVIFDRISNVKINAIVHFENKRCMPKSVG